MINIVVELSKYVILTLMIVYTVLCYYLVVGKHASDRKGLLRSQITLTFFLDFTAFVVIFLKTFDFKVVIFYAEMMIYFADMSPVNAAAVEPKSILWSISRSDAGSIL